MRRLILLVLVVLPLALGACGKKGNLETPPPENDNDRSSSY